MTLDAAEFQQVTEIAARVAAEQIRNLGRGTGGANLPIPTVKPGTVGATANAGAEVSVRADGDTVAVPAVNASGVVLEAGDRVLIRWEPPNGVYVENLLARASRGNWTPTLSGPSSNSSTSSAVGHYTRIGHKVTVYGMWTHGASSSMGTAAVFGGLPFPVISDGDALPAMFAGYVNDVSVPRFNPLAWIVQEGNVSGQLWFYNSFGGAASLLTAVSTTAPTTFATGDQIIFHGTYDTDAA